MTHILSSFQWFIFLFTNALMAPISIGYAFDFTPEMTAGLIQRTLFTAALGSLLQILFGHRLPIAEGPASIWWGIFLIYSNIVYSIQDTIIVWQTLSFGLLISGIIFLLLGLFHLTDYLATFFTPLVTATYLVLLVAQLSGPFITSMLGIDYIKDTVHMKVAIASFSILIFSFILTKARFTFLRRYSVLITLIFGWILFRVLSLSNPIAIHARNINFFPNIFPFGLPKFDLGILITVVITSLILLTNLLATTKAIDEIVGRKAKVKYDDANITSGVNQILSSIFTTVGNIPFSATAGFITMTKMKERLPFILGCFLMIGLSLFPSLMLLFSSIPAPVGYATMFLTIANLAVVGINHLLKEEPSNDRLIIFGLSIMIGFGAILIPADALSPVPLTFRSLINNGLILGVFVCIVLENITKKRE